VGDHTLAAGPDTMHVYVCVVGVAAPPMEKPLLQVVAMAVPVVPTNEAVWLLDRAVVAQLTAGKKVRGLEMTHFSRTCKNKGMRGCSVTTPPCTLTHADTKTLRLLDSATTC
jgi:hypothetical protein